VNTCPAGGRSRHRFPSTGRPPPGADAAGAPVSVLPLAYAVGPGGSPVCPPSRRARSGAEQGSGYADHLRARTPPA